MKGMYNHKLCTTWELLLAMLNSLMYSLRRSTLSHLHTESRFPIAPLRHCRVLRYDLAFLAHVIQSLHQITLAILINECDATSGTPVLRAELACY